MKIELWYDVVSPYSYLAYTALDRYRRKWGFTLVMRPAFLGGLMKTAGNQAPITLPARAPWLREDALAQGKFFDVSLTVPEGFPHLTVKAMRALTVLCDKSDARAELVAKALWHGYFAEGKQPDDLEVLKAACIDAEFNGPEIEQLLASIDTDEVKNRLKAVTAELADKGAFGMPTMFVTKDDETRMYFGSDRFERMAFEHGLRWDGPRG